MTQAMVQPGDVAWPALAGSLAWPVCTCGCVQQAGQLGWGAGAIGHGWAHVASQLMLVHAGCLAGWWRVQESGMHLSACIGCRRYCACGSCVWADQHQPHLMCCLGASQHMHVLMSCGQGTRKFVCGQAGWAGGFRRV